MRWYYSYKICVEVLKKLGWEFQKEKGGHSFVSKKYLPRYHLLITTKKNRLLVSVHYDSKRIIFTKKRGYSHTTRNDLTCMELEEMTRKVLNETNNVLSKIPSIVDIIEKNKIDKFNKNK